MSGSYSVHENIPSTFAGVHVEIPHDAILVDKRFLVYKAADSIRREYEMGGYIKILAKEVRDRVVVNGYQVSLKVVRKELMSANTMLEGEKHRIFRRRQNANNGVVMFAHSDDWDAMIEGYKSSLDRRMRAAFEDRWI
jgi:hypothetical protein